MNTLSQSPASEIESTSEQQDLSRRRALAGLGFMLGAASLATPALAQMQRKQEDGKSLGHARNKRLVTEFLESMASSDTTAALRQYCHTDCRFEVFHPFNTLVGVEAADAAFWKPLKTSFPNYEHRVAFTIANEYEGRDMVSTWGHVMGTFDEPWIGIPPTGGVTFLRFGFAAVIREGKIAKAYVLLDIIDVMRQAGFYPLREMPGSGEAWPFPPQDTGATALAHDQARGEKTLRIVREMQAGLPKPDEIKLLAVQAGKHSPHWHENMNWYGPAGIGTGRGLRVSRCPRFAVLAGLSRPGRLAPCTRRAGECARSLYAARRWTLCLHRRLAVASGYASRRRMAWSAADRSQGRNAGCRLVSPRRERQDHR